MAQVNSLQSEFEKGNGAKPLSVNGTYCKRGLSERCHSALGTLHSLLRKPVGTSIAADNMTADATCYLCKRLVFDRELEDELLCRVGDMRIGLYFVVSGPTFHMSCIYAYITT